MRDRLIRSPRLVDKSIYHTVSSFFLFPARTQSCTVLKGLIGSRVIDSDLKIIGRTLPLARQLELQEVLHCRQLTVLSGPHLLQKDSTEWRRTESEKSSRDGVFQPHRYPLLQRCGGISRNRPHLRRELTKSPEILLPSGEEAFVRLQQIPIHPTFTRTQS